MHDDVMRAAQLAQVGDVKAACSLDDDLASKLEVARTASIQCTKDLDRDLNPLARDEASRSLDRASDFFGQQKALRRKMTIYPASRWLGTTARSYSKRVIQHVRFR